MKKLFLGLVLFISFTFSVFAQIQVTPDDDFYSLARNWEMKGYIKALPQVRPYPINMIREILETVINVNNKQDASLALAQYEKVFGIKNKFYVQGEYTKKITQNIKDDEKSNGGETGITFEFGFAGDHPFTDKLSISYDLGMYVETEEYEKYTPYKLNKPVDSVFDPSKIGPTKMYLDWNTNIAYGTPDLYITGGISRVGYGPFINDGLALNDTAYHSSNLVFNVTQNKWSFVQVFEAIGAANNLGNTDNLSDGKFLAFHSILYHVNKYIDISYYENVIFGPNFNWAFMLPAPYMTVQNIGGASNNLQMGVLFEVKPVKGLKWSNDVFVDDFDVNQVVKLHLDSKIRVAGQSGIIFAPDNTICSDISAYYTVVLPYVYSHWEYDTGTASVISGRQCNYQNYLNSGKNIGSNLDPNSDRVKFDVNFRPTANLKIGFSTSLIRHANTAESFGPADTGRYMLSKTGNYLTDGSASMHQMFTGPEKGEHVNQAWNNLGFMTADHKLIINQTGLNFEFSTPKTKHGQLFLNFGYTFEYAHNVGVSNNIYPVTGTDYDEGLAYTVTERLNAETGKKETVYTLAGDGNEYPSVKAMGKSEYVQKLAKQARAEWIAKLHDEVNQYIRLSAKWVY